MQVQQAYTSISIQFFNISMLCGAGYEIVNHGSMVKQKTFTIRAQQRESTKWKII